MKKTILLFLTISYAIFAFSQNSGKGFSYQAVARDTDGQPKINAPVELRFTLLPGPQAITPSWQETHGTTTDEFGIFALTVGKGMKTAGTAAQYKDVNFASADYWLKVEIKDDGNWQEIILSQLASVPYAESAGNAQGVPVGTIIAFGGPRDKIPTGWLACDGKIVSRTEYAALYATIGSAWGHGDGASSFHIPDLRGLFLRGVDYGRGHDDGRSNRPAMYPGGNTNDNVGSLQPESFRSHNHRGNTNPNGGHGHRIMNSSTPVTWEHSSRYDSVRGYSTNVIDAAHPHAPNAIGNNVVAEAVGNHQHGIEADGGNETRPDNANVNYIIKH